MNFFYSDFFSCFNGKIIDGNFSKIDGVFWGKDIDNNFYKING